MSQTRIVITLFAQDRPGIIEAVSAVVLEHKGNWLESSLSRLSGQFTGIVVIGIEPSKKAALLDAFSALSADGIDVSVQDCKVAETEASEINALEIMVEANDRPGIIQEIAEALAQENINVDNIDTEVESASMAGYQLFRAHLFLAMPDDVSEDDLETILENISDDVMVSILES